MSKPLIQRLRIINRAIRTEREAYLKAKRRGNAAGMRKHRRAIRRLKRQRKRLYALARQWQGCTAILVLEVVPIVHGEGIPTTSGKRWETFGNPSSDHYKGNVDADARDFGVAEAFELATRIRRALTNDAGAVHRDYEEFIVRRRLPGGVLGVFRVQIIAGTHGTGPHLHVGVKRVG